MKKYGFSHGCKEGYDVVVVGSGYGGSVAACRMSLAGLKVCLIERGRRWEAQNFPVDSFKMISVVRIENSDLNFSVGPEDALFQVHIQGDSVAATACGLGGGSLVNAGVMRVTPLRARKNPKWPVEWERNWDICEASASDMLRAESVPVEFSSSRIMKQVVEEDIEEVGCSSVKLSVNFSKDSSSSSVKLGQMDSCLACGNCLSGCPYNAKNSTDKNYIQSAVQAGCTVKTECRVQYVVRNSENLLKKGSGSRQGSPRWLVFLDETEYVTADFVILSAGVFGTTEILFQSRKRGLQLSGKLGCGFSCNGNAVAYVAGSPAPLNSVGLERKQFSDIPFEERPGPSITSSYTSAKGFTIQSAVVPTAYTSLLFKGIATYGWPNGYWFWHGLIDKIKSVLGAKAGNAMVLCAMGYDDSEGKITLDQATDKLQFTAAHDCLFPRVTEAFQKIAAKLGGILFMSRYRSTAVHLLGGCNVSSSSSDGVCNPSGQVFDLTTHISVHPGLYVCDASLIPCSVGINPSLTIASVAEHISGNIVKDALNFKSQEAAQISQHFNSDPNLGAGFTFNKPVTYPVVFRETMKGYIAGMPCSVHLVMKMSISKEKRLGRLSKAVGVSDYLQRGKVGGHIIFQAMEKDKLHIIDGEVDLCQVDQRTPYTQHMHYRLLLAAPSGSRYILEGKKILNPYILGMNFWRESTTLQVIFERLSMHDSAPNMDPLRGELNISLLGLIKSLVSLRGNQKGQFVCQFIQSLYTTYISQIPRGIQNVVPSQPSCESYPSSILHHIETGDGFFISCRQWKVTENSWRPEGNNKLHNPVLLVNGYAAESFWLPTEKNDLVRAILNEGHEIWLLQPRLHPSHPSNNFTIEDIGRYDIPSAISKIQEIHEPSTQVHIVAHCVGGLASHIALMGGYVSASSIASLTCTNSSMFFNLTTSARVKMWLPLIPISMTILGKNTILPLCDSLKTSSRHYLLKAIARIIPRYERCTSGHCEIFSGIFGNAFWHSNISLTMHHFLTKETLPMLPMAAFPHLRKICNAGFIVDSNGENSFLIHPERMAVSSLYISGGRTLLVTPETSFLAHHYMKLHQPGFQHNRVVVEGFGHSDLLIGEDSHHKVFPHILSQIRLCEQVKGCNQGRNYSKECLSWGYDATAIGKGVSGCWLLTLCLIILILLCVLSSSL
ncbi:unnamed protein product [Rhodiola kirilowii]